MAAFRQLGLLVAREYGVYRMFVIYSLGGVIGFLVSYLASVAMDRWRFRVGMQPGRRLALLRQEPRRRVWANDLQADRRLGYFSFHLRPSCADDQ